jgi:hypothetical protein
VNAVLLGVPGLKLEFNGSMDFPGRWNERSRFLGKDGRPPPIWGIVKEFGHSLKDLQPRDTRRILRNIVKLQQMGIIHIDMAERQIISGKICDFSTATTSPHFVMTPELNPQLTPEWISALEFETFQFSMNDYWEWNLMTWCKGGTRTTRTRRMKSPPTHFPTGVVVKRNMTCLGSVSI